jgi:uncharacterized protein with FMN-binding domain
MPEPGKKIANSLVAMSSAAILAVYSAGYTRTRAAARRLEAQSEARIPAPTEVVLPVAQASAPPVPVAAKSTHSVSPKPKPTATPTIDLPAPPVELAPAPAEVVANTPVPSPEPPPPPPPAPKWKDGTYLGWGSSRHGDIQAAVTIENGRIASATIAQCLTRYSCDVIVKLPPEVPQRQSPDVDYVSGATQSANAFYYAVVDALGRAK